MRRHRKRCEFRSAVRGMKTRRACSRHHERPGTLGAPQKHSASIHWQVRAGPGSGRLGARALASAWAVEVIAGAAWAAQHGTAASRTWAERVDGRGDARTAGRLPEARCGANSGTLRPLLPGPCAAVLPAGSGLILMGSRPGIRSARRASWPAVRAALPQR